MAQEPAPIIYSNVLPWRGCEKLYLDTRTADVFFVFGKDGNVKIPAHKNILSANSKLFDVMFYGPRKQEGDIPIDKSTPEAFKEFLQFFYLGTVKLTNVNAVHVMNLGKQYLVDECCKASSNFTEQTLTLDNMCFGYEVAIFFEQTHLMKFCEQKIGENPKEIFQSKSFLSCRSNLLARILQLDTFNCDESVVFDGCMAWAKAACIKKGLDGTNMQNIRNQLGDLFYEIRFGDMTAESFYPRYRSYGGLFSIEEFTDIIGMISSKEYRPPKFNRNERKTSQIYKNNTNDLICDRTDPTGLNHQRYDLGSGTTIQNTTSFTSNCELVLKTIHCNELFPVHVEKNIPFIPAIMNVIDGSTGKNLYSDQVIFLPLSETNVHLPTPIIIRPGVKYQICFNLQIDKCYTLMTLKTKVQMDQGIEIDFGYDYGDYSSNKNPGLVKKIIFMKPKE
ncbi:BTB/POZ domain-containing protein 6-B-like [Sitodiplosis mosellana]|uniref:BTB/POZ domain-containing protein 6-B-like n=1 Tax=Sitodiplosis mosellana TaxID=263140 RepID=UPI00244448FE|nr:BTB/POZ domain-containing protein 6-B-like [Sitodiplosis mosellana]XP_055306144.1 BTB/POZ domain-containing protein 6-B-like [Sitodiplosis mosellana]XP_055306145.1 BTB/POZ domain-containing protein 6-B-like [Sitodiplosis mosellana]